MLEFFASRYFNLYTIFVITFVCGFLTGMLYVRRMENSVNKKHKGVNNG